MRNSVVRVMVLLALAQACTEPKQPYEGEYDVTTTLDTYQWETGAGFGFPPSECPPSGYCNHSRPFGGATLSGILVVRRAGTDPAGDPIDAGGSFSGTFCSSADVTGCTSVAPQSDDYDDYGSVISSNVMSIRIRKRGAEPISSEGPVIVFSGPFGGDVISGTVTWLRGVGRFPDRHLGHFVARKR